VHRFFGSREQLFVAALELPVAPGVLVAAVLAGGVGGVGERLVRTLLTLWDPPGGFAPFVVRVRGAVDDEAAATMLREFVTRGVIGRSPPARRPPGPSCGRASPARRSSAWRWRATSATSPGRRVGVTASLQPSGQGARVRVVGGRSAYASPGESVGATTAAP
jgi:hypothetical protein